MFWNRKPKPEDSPKPLEEIMRPGLCECEHERCCHENGKGRCHAEFPPDEEWPKGAWCACQIFIRDDSDETNPQPETPSPAELEKLYTR